MTRAPRVVLTGFMGSGKSTIGRSLATALDVEFVDTDDEIERRSGRTIPEIFAEDGEAAFRELERSTVLTVLDSCDGVVALGGGAATVPAIAAALADHHVVYLQIGAEDGFARVAHSGRPLLAAPDAAARYAELLAGRIAAYEAVARRTVDASGPVPEVVRTVLAGLDPAVSKENRR